VKEIQMTKQQKAKASPILLTEAESDYVAGGDDGDPFRQIAQLLGQPWWVSAINDGNVQFVFGRNRF
jgi:hypothetical protein